jgi:acyl-CoA synthetase (NDP forming)
MTLVDENAVLSQYKALFEPESIAVAGASETGGKMGNRFIETLRSNGFQGNIYPIHPKAAEIDGLPAYSSIADTPEPVDYAFVAIRAQIVAPFLRSAGGRLKFAQVLSSGFSETAHGVELEAELVRAGQETATRIIGPNCIGMHSPRGHLALIDGAMEPGGGISFLSQSGGLSLDVLRRGKALGLKFSGVVSLGNCADIGPNDLLEYFLADPDTKVIGLYLESVRRGRQFFEQLKKASAKKPVIILKGGQTSQGQRAAASHTGSMVDDNRLWDAVIRQTGSFWANDLDDLIDHFVGLQFMASDTSPSSDKVILFGNGGGTNVIATDQFSQSGLDVTVPNPALQGSLRDLELPDGASIANPIDVPANILMRDDGATACRIVESVREKERSAALVIHLNLPVIAGYKQNDVITTVIEKMVENQVSASGLPPLHLVLRSDGDPETEALKIRYREEAMAAGIPVFNELKESARVLAALYKFKIYREKRAAVHTNA